MYEFLGLAGRIHDGLQITILLDRKSGNRLACLGNAVSNFLGPARLDTYNDNSGHIGVGTGPDNCAEMQVEVFAELQPAIGVWQRKRALDIVRNRFNRCI